MTTTLGEKQAAGAPPRAANGAPTVGTAVLLATAPGEDGRPAAMLPWEGATVVGRLAQHVASVGAAAVHVVTRPEWAEAVEQAVGSGTIVEASEDPAADLRAVARIAREAAGGLVIAQGDVITQREALAGLVADPRVSTGVLATVGRFGRPFTPKIRTARGRVVSVASPYHAVHRPTARFLGVLKVSGDDRELLADVADQLAALTAERSQDWDDELERKVGSWRGALARIAARIEAEENGDLERDDDGLDEAALPMLPEDIVLSDEDEEELTRRRAAAPNDVAALLAAGLVRAGGQVAVNHLRKLFWARPLTRADIDRAATDIQEYDEDKVLLDSAVKAADGFFTTFFVSPYSKYLARWAARRGMTPNQVTTISVLIGVLAGIAFATGERWGLIAGAILLQLSFTTDCVDGQLARYTRQFSKLGAWLDSIFDRTKEYVVFAGLAIGAAAAGDDVWTLAGAALILQTGRHMADFSFGAARQQVIGAAEQPPLAQPSDRIGGPTPAERVAARAERAAAVSGTVPTLPAREVTSAGAAPPAIDPPRPVPLNRRVLGLWRKLDRLPGLIWIKRMVAFPIGERFAVISITAAVWDPRTTFTVLLAWGAVATVYTTAGRVLRSVAR